jgi:hypothetical protein
MDYKTPGSESQAASELTDHFRVLLGIAFLIMVAARYGADLRESPLAQEVAALRLLARPSPTAA